MSGEPGPSARIVASWQANAGAWTDAIRGGRIESRRAGTDAAIRDAVLRRRPARVLDLGCGEGWLCRALGARGIDALGLDACAELVAAAAALGGGRYLVCDYGRLPAEEQAFDCIVCNFSLFDEPLEDLLHALRRRLAPAGALLVQTLYPDAQAPVQEGWRTETFAGCGAGFRAPMPWFCRSRGSWEALFERCGFTLARVDTPPHPRTGAPLSLLFEAEAAGPEAAAGCAP